MESAAETGARGVTFLSPAHHFAVARPEQAKRVTNAEDNNTRCHQPNNDWYSRRPHIRHRLRAGAAHVALLRVEFGGELSAALPACSPHCEAISIPAHVHRVHRMERSTVEKAGGE